MMYHNVNGAEAPSRFQRVSQTVFTCDRSKCKNVATRFNPATDELVCLRHAGELRVIKGGRSHVE